MINAAAQWSCGSRRTGARYHRSLDGEPVTGADDLVRLLNRERIGRDVAIDVLRRGQLRTFTVKPFERPAKPSAA